MEGGLGLFGLGMFLLSIALLYARTAFGLAWLVLALSLASMGLAFSSMPNRRELSLGMGVVLLVAAGVSLALGVAWWWVVATGIFGVAYVVLWAEFRFPYFQHPAPPAGRPPVETRRQERAGG